MSANYLLLGATGDLARGKIVPALAKLHAEGVLGEGFTLFASGRREWNDEDYRAFIAPHLRGAAEETTAFLAHTRYLRADLGAADAFRSAVSELSPSLPTLAHLSVAPHEYPRAIEALGEAGVFARGNARLLIEKPFGFDAASARALEALIERYLPESAVFRIDHYLGKDAVRGLEDALPDPASAEELTLTLFESNTVGERGAFYDRVGVVRDVVQNHLLQMLALLASGDAAPASRARAIEALGEAEVRELGQYEGYRSEDGVAPDSVTPTYADISVHATLANGKRIPVRLIAGKALAENRVAVRVKRNGKEEDIVIQSAAAPGNDAYARLIREALASDRTYFVSLAEALAEWRLMDPLIASLPPLPLISYKPGEMVYSESRSCSA